MDELSLAKKLLGTETTTEEKTEHIDTSTASIVYMVAVTSSSGGEVILKNENEAIEGDWEEGDYVEIDEDGDFEEYESDDDELEDVDDTVVDMTEGDGVNIEESETETLAFTVSEYQVQAQAEYEEEVEAEEDELAEEGAEVTDDIDDGDATELPDDGEAEAEEDELAEEGAEITELDDAEYILTDDNSDDESDEVVPGAEISDGYTVAECIGVVNEGDRVAVMVQNGQMTVLGVAGSGDEQKAEITHTIETLEATNIVVENLQATKANITDLEVTNANIADLQVTKANISDLNVTNAKVNKLEADVGNIADLEAFNATIENLKTNKLDVQTAQATYANIDFSNINKAAIEEFFSKSGIIENLVVGEGTITGNLVGVTIKGDMIEAGTVVADKLVVKGENGLYYKLNTNGVTTEAEQTDYNSLNGNIITAQSITATKIAVDDLVAFDATIGGFNISENAIYSGVKDSITNTTTGFYVDANGQMYLGDALNYLRYYQTQDGAFKLDISAENITFGNEGMSIETAIDNAVGNITLGVTNHIVLNRMQKFQVTGGLLKNSTRGSTISDYIVNTNTRYDLLGFKIDVLDTNITYTISGYTDLPKIKFAYCCFGDGGTLLENYYIESNVVEIDVINGKFQKTFNVLEGTKFFHIGVGMDVPGVENGEHYDYYISKLQLERGNVSTDWNPSPEDVNGVILNGLDSIKNGDYTEINLTDVKTMDGTVIKETNYFVYENGNLTATSQPIGEGLHAGFHVTADTNTREYLLFCYDSNLEIGIYELDANGNPLSFLVMETVNPSSLNGVTQDTIQYKIELSSDEVSSFYLILGHSNQSDYIIESLKLFKVSSNINTTLNIKGDANIDNNLSVIGNTKLESDLNVSGKVKVYDNLDVTGAVDVGSDLSVIGTVDVSSNLNVNMSSTLKGIYVTALSYLRSTLYLTSASATTYYINSSGNAKFNTLNASGATSLAGTLAVTGNTTLTGWLKPNNGVYLPNAKYIYFYNTSGNSVQVMTLNTSNNLVIGHGGYTNSVGSTNIYGNDIQLISKGDITTSGVLTIGNGSGTGGLINSQVNLGTSNASDGNRYYLNGNGTGRFNVLRYASSQAISSRRYKNNIDYKDAEFWHDSLMQIKPCTFYYKNDNETKHIGLIAEDLYELIPDLVDTDNEGKPASIEYANLTIPLIGEVQRLNKVVDEQAKKISSLEDELKQLKDIVTKLVS